jgi:hypothetical protein
MLPKSSGGPQSPHLPTMTLYLVKTNFRGAEHTLLTNFTLSQIFHGETALLSQKTKQEEVKKP